jgi:hypothetical protein
MPVWMFFEISLQFLTTIGAANHCIAFTCAAYGENAFAIRLDFDRREDAEEFGKHFNERAIDRQLAYQPGAHPFALVSYALW